MSQYSKNKNKKMTGLPKLEVVETKLDKVVKERFQGGLIVYGVGAHLTDMLRWHPDLASRIVGVIDKNEEKIGKRAPGLTITVKSPEALRDLPAGTQVAVSALRYYSEIVKELHGLNPGLVCLNIDQAYTLLKETEAKGMLVYGVGAHLADMLSWHPELAGRIGRIFDKDEKKWGQKAPGTGRTIESTEVLRHAPAGTRIAISAIRYYDEIVEELYVLNPGLICENIDVVYEKLPPMPVKHVVAQAASDSVVSVRHGLSDIQKQRLRGKEAAERWRRRFLMQCANVKKIFWGTKGIRASYLRKELQPLMGRGDIFIEEDLSLRGQVANGLPICIPDALKDVRGKFVIIVLDGDYPRIRELLQDYGYVENVDFVEGRQLLGEDENGYINVPCIDKTQSGMIVYGLGDHLKDMLNWHPELAGRISRIIDKDPKKTGILASGVGVSVEPPAVLRDLPSGTEVAISAIKYLTEIEKDIHAIQPGLICRNIDAIWKEYVSVGVTKSQTLKMSAVKLSTEKSTSKAGNAKKTASVTRSKSCDYETCINASPEEYSELLKIFYYKYTGKELDLDNPKDFNEKIQWLKINDSTPLKTVLADKYLARDWIREKVGDKYLVPLLGAWNSFDEIDFNSLPDKFVLKCNHGSGWNLIVTDKSKMDIIKEKKKFDKWMGINYAFCWGLELHYKNIHPKIIAEKYLESSTGIIDYRFYCFNGVPRQVWVDIHSGTPNHLRCIYDMDWTKINMRCTWPDGGDVLSKRPLHFDEMKKIAIILSENFSFVRVDFFEIKGRIYVGEMTFTPMSGIGKFEPEEWNRKLGDMLLLK